MGPPSKPTPPKHTPSARQLTDESLAAEREKTDSELAKRGAHLEEDADDVVAAARDRADDVLAQARAIADEKLGPALSGAAERAIVDDERKREDVATRAERATADDQLAQERDARRRALIALLALEREQTDQHLLFERERADLAIGSRDDFLAMASHDLRNLLAGIALAASALRNLRCEDEDTRRQVVGDAERIHRYTARMNRLVSDLLDVVSIEAGRLAVLPQRHDATELLRETVDVFQPVAAAKRISMVTEVRADSLLARYDHERILQVLANLIGNAMKFTPEGGRIEILVEPVDSVVRFAVRDSGSGMAPEMLSVIFERFWQIPETNRSGLGLGLYISRCIVEAHGGSLWAESHVGEGSTFYFTLPAAGTRSSTFPGPSVA
jgi:signal transduction histidine kinase